MYKYVMTAVRLSNRSMMTEANHISSMQNLLKNIVNHADSPTQDMKTRNFCDRYQVLRNDEKKVIIKSLASVYEYDHEIASKAAHSYLSLMSNGPEHKLRAAERLQNVLVPQYSKIFSTICKLEHGIKFLVDLRADVLNILSEMDSREHDYYLLKSLNSNLKELLALIFNVGFLSLQRITWDSSCYMLQKISEYEAVHPIRSWTDLKQRVGLYRRCYVFTHSSMPREPLVVLHTALTEDISSSINSIVTHRYMPPVDAPIFDQTMEDPSKIQAAIFYSVTSTQKGLQEIQLSTQLIKKVVGEVLKEFPHIGKLSSLSPIPGFRNWLLMEICKAKEGVSSLATIFSEQDRASLRKLYSDESSDIWHVLSFIIASNRWTSNSNLKECLKQPLMRACAHYLFKEKRRSCALNYVAHFHLRNGAVLWRLNWEADLSPRGLDNSCGIMVNYRYFMEETDINSEKYIQDHYIKTSENVQQLLEPVANKSYL